MPSKLCYDQDMATLIIIVVLGFFLSFFATQNTGQISLHFLNYSLSGISIYVVVIGALLVGLFFAWVISLVSGIGTGFTMRGKESKIKDYKKENAELMRQIHQLELTNTRLETAANLPSDDKSL